MAAATERLTTPEIETLRFAGAGGLTLFADAAGPVNGRPVLLMHGGGQTRHAWRRALRELAAGGWRAKMALNGATLPVRPQPTRCHSAGRSDAQARRCTRQSLL